jgi:predicted nucleic acid-binding protein
VTVVVDASVALKWVLEEDGTDEALALWDRWQAAGERVVAPPIFRAEVANALRQVVRRGLATTREAADLLETLLETVAVEEPPPLYGRSLEMAHAFDLGSVYDALYLALAESEGCEVWTADRRLARAVDNRFPLLRSIGP